MTQSVFVGYPGQVWATCWQSMSWLNILLNGGAVDAASIDDPAAAVLATLRNGLNSLDAWQTGIMLTQETQNLATVEAIPLTLDPTTTAYFVARIAAVSAAATEITALPSIANPFTAVALLTAGQPAIADPQFLEWCMTFEGETAPAGLSPDILPDDATAAAQAWLTVANAIAVVQGDNLTIAYDTAARMFRCSSVIAMNIGQVVSGPFTEIDTTALWNGAVALPTILMDASTLASAPASLSAQQVGVIRYALSTQIAQLSLLLLSLRTHNVTQAVTANLRNSETLMDLAARTNGDFETWKDIAILNKIQPPFPGPTNQTLALSGQSLFTSGNGIIPDPNQQRPTYEANVLGTDYDFGPINGTQPPWLGDISLITGLLNFARSIGRRLQTPLGSLIYHTQYGSSIPPEVGAIQSQDEASRLAAYGWSAIIADPRTGAVLSIIASVQPGFLATFSAVVSPIGPNQTSVQINEVIGTNP